MSNEKKHCGWCDAEFVGNRFDFFCSDCQAIIDKAYEEGRIIIDDWDDCEF